MATLDTPRFTHDCDACQWLGQFFQFDLYYCAGPINVTVIARYGSDGGDYASGLPFSYGADPALTEALDRARTLGLTRGGA